jgi:hypothetical protein
MCTNFSWNQAVIQTLLHCNERKHNVSASSQKKLRRDEESKLVQRVKVKHIQVGSDNTKYFNLTVNGKHGRKKVFFN